MPRPAANDEMPADAAVARGNVRRELGLEADKDSRAGGDIRRRKDRNAKIIPADAGVVLVDVEVELVVDAGCNPDARD